MTVRIKKYFRFWFWIDLVGLGISVALIIGYLYCSCIFNERIQNLWSNLSIELLGVWLSVRIIDFLLQRHKNFKETRLQQLSMLRYFHQTACYIRDYHNTSQDDVDKLNEEIKYFDKRWPKRKKQFYKDEIEQIIQLRTEMPQIIDTCIEIKRTCDESLSEENKRFKTVLSKQLAVYRAELEALRENVWEESHPDD